MMSSRQTTEISLLIFCLAVVQLNGHADYQPQQVHLAFGGECVMDMGSLYGLVTIHNPTP